MSSKSFSILGKNIKAQSRADLEPYISELEKFEDVEEVHFGGNSLGVEACQAIAEVLKTKKSLKVADFADVFTGRLISEIPTALSAICDALQSHTSLVELDLSDNAFGGRCADAMVPFLENNRHLQVFKLNNNGLGIWGGTVVAKALLENAKKSKAAGEESNLKTVVCGRNRLENGSAPYFAEAFAAHGNLIEVRLPQNGIRMEGIHALAQGLSKCPKLESLDLQDNTCTESGTRSISASLPSWPELRTLNLSDCLLSPKGGVSLATALEKGANPKVETLKLQYGEMDARAIHILAKAIQEHLSSLTTLELNGNRADPEDECIERIKDALASHGHEDALDELDDMEEPEDDEDEASEDEKESSDEKADEVVEPVSKPIDSADQ
ncbi:Ran GTPase activator [Filobasidium floriforme]|uniref:Ran GTPase activator n=1 Tax=Filobasidium floriforme TaxID=5210 RepID=UPI001E8D7466|nr:Ran GTPase activator [Filobasidium floriforme]KAH8090642.1 Ran GTPase activator [Filobasidium floriforme]